jgi:hypothetical protein
VETIRQRLISRFPPPPRAAGPDDQLGHALYVVLSSLRDPDVTIDGWTLFKVVREADDLLDAVGLMTLLPSGAVPMALQLKTTESGVAWSAQISLRDEVWLSWPDSKRWKNVYLFAGGDRAVPPWSWDRTYEGFVLERARGE